MSIAKLNAAIAALVVHVNNHNAIPPEQIAKAGELRKTLSKCNKEELITKVVNMTLKLDIKVHQGNLFKDILTDPACALLSYEEICENILLNMETKQKYSVENLKWHKSQLQSVHGVEGIINRPTTKEKDDFDRKITKEALALAAQANK